MSVSLPREDKEHLGLEHTPPLKARHLWEQLYSTREVLCHPRHSQSSAAGLFVEELGPIIACCGPGRSWCAVASARAQVSGAEGGKTGVKNKKGERESDKTQTWFSLPLRREGRTPLWLSWQLKMQRALGKDFLKAMSVDPREATDAKT